MAPQSSDLEIIRRFAPGTPLRQAVDLVLRQGTGALIFFGSGAVVDQVSSGGFPLADVPFTPQRVAELAKMDGGIVIDDGAQWVLRANVQFIPDPQIETAETGTRFRTAERLARQTGRVVLSVSEEGRSAAIVFYGDRRYQLQNPTVLLAQANQNLNSLERLRRRVDEAEDRLTRLEVDDVVTYRDVVLLLQRAEVMRRLYADVARVALELGQEAQLIRLQAADLMDGVEDLMRLVYADYHVDGDDRTVFERLAEVETNDLYDAPKVAGALELTPLDAPVRPRGLRALAGVPRLPESVRLALLEHFGDYQKLIHASVAELDQVEGVGRTRARQLRSYLDRLLEMGTLVALD